MKQYEGKEFAFHSPFTAVEGWRTGDRGRLIRQVYPHGQSEDEPRDVWLALNLNTGKRQHVLDVEAVDDHGNSIFAECPE